jgi:phytoene dehydrogenase-like protein
MDSYFQDARLKAVFISILADFFTPPSQFMGLGVFALNPEPSFDCRIPVDALGKDTEPLYHYSILGGIGTLVDALVRQIQGNGGQVLTRQTVTKILVDAGCVRGIQTGDSQEYAADAVIATGAAKETFLNLVGKEHLTANFIQQVEQLPLMDSVFMVHLGIDMDPGPQLPGVCTYYYGTYDLENGIRRAREGEYHEGQEGFVVHVPTHHSPEMAPDGQHSVTLYTICPDRLKQGSWEENKDVFANRLVACAEKYIPGLREHTRVRVIVTAEDFQARTHTAHHAFGGIAPLLGAKRIPYQTPIKGLWFAGAQSESGGGVNSVIPAAYKLAKRLA